MAEDGMETDPICGMEVAPSSEHRAERDGEMFYFCSADCRERFLRGEDGQERATPDTGHAAIYTCPMHPEVEQEGPGSCPKCGMDLEPKETSAEEEDDPELKSMTRRLWICALLSIPVVVIAMGDMVGIPIHA